MQVACIVSEYDLIVAAVEAEPGRHTTKALARAMVVGHGGQPAIWARRVRELEVGGALVLALNPEARQRKGSAFDLKEFHTYALNLGGMGLDQLREELARF